MSNKLENTVFTLLVGAAFGAVAGILLAPDKGSNTLKKIKDGLDHDKNDLENKFGEAADDFREKISDVKFDIEETYQNLISNMSHRTEDIISFLESKLADLKKANAGFQK